VPAPQNNRFKSITMADSMTSVPILLTDEERSPLISLAKGEITSEMNGAIDQLRTFEGSREEAEVFLGEMIKELVTRVLIPPPH
jgi:hypothetical protein